MPKKQHKVRTSGAIRVKSAETGVSRTPRSSSSGSTASTPSEKDKKLAEALLRERRR